jgi:hypothetical protein
MPYVLFLLMVAGTALIIWLMGYGPWRDDTSGEFAGENLRTFLFPWSIPSLLDSGQFWGAAVFVSILTASSVSTEFGWGTARQLLVRGQSRAQFLAIKIAALAIICTVFLLTALGIGILFSLWATDAAGKPITLDVPGGPTVPEIGLMILRAALGILPYGLLAFMLTTVGRSTALGVAGTIGYMFAEGIIIAVMESIGGVTQDFRDIALGHHVSSLIAANRIGAGDYNYLAPRDLARAAEVPDVNVATLVVPYCLVFLAVTFRVFLRVTSACTSKALRTTVH